MTSTARPERYKNKPPVQPPAKPYLSDDTVEHPRLAGIQEKVVRVVNTIEHMRQRKQLGADREQNERAYRAAERMWLAHETVYGQTGGVMDLERSRGGGVPGGPPLPRYMEAAETLRVAKAILYALDHRVVVLIACETRSIEETAQIIFRRTPTRSDKEEIGRSLRTGLRELADHWWSAGDKRTRGDQIAASHAADADPKTKPYAVGVAPIERGKTVHATRTRVFRNK